MYVRLVRFNFGPVGSAKAMTLAEDLVPAIQEQPGCEGVTFFGSPSDGEYGLYVLWRTEQAAEDARGVIGPRLSQHFQGNLRSDPEIQLFEVLKSSAPVAH